MAQWLGTSWTTLASVVVSTIAFYVTVMAALRLAGRRTVAQISAFDFVVTVAIGSLLSTTVVSRDPTYAQGAAALVTLLAMQVAVAYARKRFPRARKLLDFSARVIARDGRIDTSPDPLGAQLTEDDVWSMLRQRGFFDLGRVGVIILEPQGKISVVPPEANNESPFPGGE